jgi:hypothetical protein
MWCKTMLAVPIVLLSSLMAGGVLSGMPGDGVINNASQTWRVLYHKNQKQPPLNYIGVRLTIKPGAAGGDTLSGDLTLWTSTRQKMVGGMATTVYDKSTWIQHLGMEGEILTNSGSNDDRKLQRFALKKTSPDGSRLVTVMGFHYTGRAKGKGKNKNRNDDQLIVRIKDLPVRALAPKKVDGDCDKQPPDEDVLTEDPDDPQDPDEPIYDAE